MTLAPELDEKQCTGCGETRPTSQFYRLSAQKTGLNPRCKPCVNDYNAAYQTKNYVKMTAWNRQRVYNDRVKRYGLTSEQYDTLLARSGGLCESCGQPESIMLRDGTRTRLAVDHDHRTGKVRGLLCKACNVTLGRIENNPEIVAQLARFIEKYG